MGFSYRQCISELIYTLIICQINILIAIITLSQYSINLAKTHYVVVKYLCIYLNAIKQDGLTYCKTELQLDLLYTPDPRTTSDENTLRIFELQHNTLKIIGACNATWALDYKHRRSMGGVVIMLAGVAVYYQT